MILLSTALIAFLASFYGAIDDLRRLRIHDVCSIVIVVAFACAYAADRTVFGLWWEPWAAGLAMFVLTYIGFAFNLFGAGDSKIGSALALWVGLHAMLAYMFYMFVAGGVLAAAALYIKKKKPFAHASPQSWVGQLQEGRNALPYGVAITIGAWAAIVHMGILHHHLDELFSLIH